MEPDARYTLVGSAILVLTAAVILAVVWLRGRGQQNLTRYYVIYFEKHSLSGLQVDSYVTMRGIRVGTVKNLHIQPDDIERVRVVVALAGGTPVKEDTRAVIQRNLLTGLASIDLVGGSQGAPPLETIEGREEHPVIPEGQPGLEELKQDLPELLRQTSAAIQDVRAFLSEENRENANRILANLEVATSNLTDTGRDMKKTMDALYTMANDVKAFVREVGPEVRGARSAFEQSARSLSAATVDMSKDLGLAVQKLANAAERFEDPRAVLFGPEADVLGPGEKRR